MYLIDTCYIYSSSSVYDTQDFHPARFFWSYIKEIVKIFECCKTKWLDFSLKQSKESFDANII